jgi:hypothetical protein
MSHCSSRELVIELSKVKANGETFHLVSFASKYIHFYHDASVFIFDRYAAIALAHHYGFLADQIERQITRWREDYNEYWDSIVDLKRPEAASAKAVEIDHYLWLAGNWVTWREHGDKAKISRPLKEFFKRGDMAQRTGDTFRKLLKSQVRAL